MGDLMLSLEKKVEKFEDIEAAAKLVLANIDEPRLKNKKLVNCMVEPEKMMEVHKMFSGLIGIDKGYSAEVYPLINAFYVHSPPLSYLIFLKKGRALPGTLESYFHEVGHAANFKFNVSAKAHDKDHLVRCEMLAESFSGWAREEFNRLDLGFYFKPHAKVLAERADMMLSPESKIASDTRAMNATMLQLQVMENLKTSRDMYHWLQDNLYSGKQVKVLWV